jgi:glycosyltransferase involved in cell wall biosynthesis
MKFSICTPSFRQFEWLKLCSTSVQDQEGVEVEHIVQDAGTGPDLETWILQQPRTRLFVEKDAGMFDAINRGWRRATGDYVAQLNCDEQYLPGALQSVGEFFEMHPGVDVIYADSLIMDQNGNLRTYWKAISLSGFRVAAGGISNPTASIFFRRRLLEEGFYYDPRWTCVGDAEWSRAVLAAGKKSATLAIPTSVYAVTGKNLSTTAKSAVEIAEWEATSPIWIRLLKWPVRAYNAIFRKVLEPSTRTVSKVSYYRPGPPDARYVVTNVTLSTRWPLDLYSAERPEPHREMS